MSPWQQLSTRCVDFSKLSTHCVDNFRVKAKKSQVIIQGLPIKPLTILSTQILSECGYNVFTIFCSFGSIKLFFGYSLSQFPIA